MTHHKRKGPRKHGARAQAGRFHDPDDAASSGSWPRLKEKESEQKDIDEGLEEPEGDVISLEVRCFRCGDFAAIRTDGPSAQAVGQTHRWEAGVLDVNGSESCFAAICCWPCFWEFEPDLWILPEHWTQAQPQVPLEKLPALDHEDPKAWDATHYPWPLESQELGAP